jgi:hypothetical protein
VTQHETTTPGPSLAGSGWFPDPSRTHELRYYDGSSWTDHVSDSGQTTRSPLGALPPGLVAWFSPEVMVRSASEAHPVEEVPRVKMWVLACLSACIFWSRTPTSIFVFPLGIGFAIWCWRVTAEALASHEAAGSPAVTEIKAARWVAVGLAVVCLLQIPLWTH